MGDYKRLLWVRERLISNNFKVLVITQVISKLWKEQIMIKIFNFVGNFVEVRAIKLKTHSAILRRLNNA